MRSFLSSVPFCQDLDLGEALLLVWHRRTWLSTKNGMCLLGFLKRFAYVASTHSRIRDLTTEVRMLKEKEVSSQQQPHLNSHERGASGSITNSSSNSNKRPRNAQQQQYQHHQQSTSRRPVTGPRNSFVYPGAGYSHTYPRH